MPAYVVEQHGNVFAVMQLNLMHFMFVTETCCRRYIRRWCFATMICRKVCIVALLIDPLVSSVL